MDTYILLMALTNKNETNLINTLKYIELQMCLMDKEYMSFMAYEFDNSHMSHELTNILENLLGNRPQKIINALISLFSLDLNNDYDELKKKYNNESYINKMNDGKLKHMIKNAIKNSRVSADNNVTRETAMSNCLNVLFSCGVYGCTSETYSLISIVASASSNGGVLFEIYDRYMYDLNMKMNTDNLNAEQRNLEYDIEQVKFFTKNVYMSLMNIFMQMDHNEVPEVENTTVIEEKVEKEEHDASDNDTIVAVVGEDDTKENLDDYDEDEDEESKDKTEEVAEENEKENKTKEEPAEEETKVEDEVMEETKEVIEKKDEETEEEEKDVDEEENTEDDGEDNEEEGEEEQDPEENMELFRVVICCRLPSSYPKDDVIEKYEYKSKEFSNNVIRAKAYNKDNEPKKQNKELKDMVEKYKYMKLSELKELAKKYVEL